MDPEEKILFFKGIKQELDFMIDGAVEAYRQRLRDAFSQGMEDGEICPRCCTIAHGYLSDSSFFGGVKK